MAKSFIRTSSATRDSNASGIGAFDVFDLSCVSAPRLQEKEVEFLANGYKFGKGGHLLADNVSKKTLHEMTYRLIHQQLVHDGLHDIARDVATATGLNTFYGDEVDPPVEQFGHSLASKHILPASQSTDPADKNGKSEEVQLGFFAKLAKFLASSNPDVDEALPAREELSEEERVVTAAVNIVRATQFRSPTYCPSGQVRLFLILHSPIYVRFRSLLVYLHMLMIFFEPPPHQRDLPQEELRSKGYYVFETRFFDAFCTLFYLTHSLLTARLEGGVIKLLKTPGRQMFFFVMSVLLFLDMLIGLNPTLLRPFRPLRPLMIVLGSPTMTRVVKGCLLTLPPLVRTWLLLFIMMLFYTVLGLNVFSGSPDADTPSEKNAFGAACLAQGGFSHPFRNFGDSFVSMYVLGTTDNSPGVIWPFYACECDVAWFSCNATTTTWRAEGSTCVFRRVLSSLFFVSYVVIGVLGLANVILAICYVNFESISKEALIHSALRKRCSLMEAFYYLHKNGYLHFAEFEKCSQLVRKMNLGSSGHPDADRMFFESLDTNGDGYLDLLEFFQIVEMMQTKLMLGRSGQPGSLYQSWKKSSARKSLIKFLHAKAFGVVVIEAIVYFLIIGTALMSANPNFRGSTRDQWGNFVTFIFVVEIVLKILAFGRQTYWSNLWNRFDFYVTGITLAAYAGTKLVEKGYMAPYYREAFQVIPTVRVLRLVRLLSQISSDFATALVAVAASIPATVNILMLIFFYLYFFAAAGMELLSSYAISSIFWAGTNGFTTYDAFVQYPGDWSNFENSLFTTVVLIMGNTWSNNMGSAMAAYGWRICWFFMLFNFIGKFLLLNVVQSVFVYAFSTLWSKDDLEKTWQHQLTELDTKVRKKHNPKRVARKVHIDNLILTAKDFKNAYLEWQNQFPDNHLKGMLEELDKVYYLRKLDQKRNSNSHWARLVGRTDSDQPPPTNPTRRQQSNTRDPTEPNNNNNNNSNNSNNSSNYGNDNSSGSNPVQLNLHLSDPLTQEQQAQARRLQMRQAQRQKTMQF